MISGKMTREEAKIFLLQLHTDKQLNKSEHEALRIAIELLGQEPCEDCISREQAIKQCGFGMTCLHIADCLRKLPPVTPLPKPGRWIFDEILDKHYYCSECKSMGVDYWDYCPYCGAKMQKVNADEDND